MPDQTPDDNPGAGPSADLGTDSRPSPDQTRAERVEEAVRAADALPQAEVHRGWSFSLVWVLPIVAAIIAAWLGLRSIAAEGPAIKIAFETADGRSRKNRLHPRRIRAQEV